MNTNTQGHTYIIWILGLLSTISPLAIDLYLPAFDQMAVSMDTTVARITLSVSSYFIGMAIGQIIYGPLLDRFGRKAPVYFGLGLFIMASMGCVVASTDTQLIGLRFLQALGGSVAWVAAITMVRDFFPVEKSARIFSLLILILGVSPLLAPTFGSFLATSLGWESIFTTLAVIATLTVVIVYSFLPTAREPDHEVELKLGPMLSVYGAVLKQPTFYTYVFSGAFAFSTLFIYVAGSPLIFMELYKVSAQTYGAIFAGLSVGFIGGSQLNILLTRYYKSEHIFKMTLFVQFVTNVVFLLCAINGWLNLYSTLVLFFVCLSCIGLSNPNASALALSAFTKNMGSASALMGFIQLGVAALASSGVGLLNAQTTTPIVALMLATCAVSVIIYLSGKRSVRGQVSVTPAG